jgi:hypothetical protein
MQDEQGQCARCASLNPYTIAVCAECGARLPWAAAQEALRREAAERTAEEQAQKLRVVKEQAKAAKAEARLIAQTTPISERKSSPVTGIVVWVMALGLVGFLVYGYISAERETAKFRLEEAQQSSASGAGTLTLDGFKQLSTGMSPEAAVAVLGPPTTSSTLEMSGVTTLAYHWAERGAMISASFQNGGLVAKSQSGL